MRYRYFYEATDNEDEVEQIVDEIVNLNAKTKIIKGGYGKYDFRQYVEALKFAQLIVKDKKLKARIKSNYQEVYEYLEDINYHTANLALDYLFNKRQFNKMLTDYAGYVFQYAK